MKLAIIGYGKMGKVIEKVATDRGHEIVLKINSSNRDQLNNDNLKQVDAAIEFSRPESAVDNIKTCLQAEVPVAIGTTGWYAAWKEVKELCKSKKGSLLAATNFSVGVNLFFELNRKLAELMSERKEYSAFLEETHHMEKLDSPSGTAISIAEGLIEKHPAYKEWKNESTNEAGVLSIISYREPNVPGTHTVTYNSPIDKINISHEAKSREGFALGAVLAAEYIHDKKGIFQMRDVLNF